MLRAREQKTAHATIGIDQGLNVGEQLGCALDFVEHAPIRQLGQKTAWIIQREGALIRILQREAGATRHDGARQGGLARLSRPSHRRNRKALQERVNERSGRARDHG